VRDARDGQDEEAHPEDGTADGGADSLSPSTNIGADMDTPEGFDDYLKAMESLSGVLTGIEHQRHEIIRELISAKGSQAPKQLYHYTSRNGLLGIIQSNQLWATDSRSLNDHTELVYGSNLIVHELERYAHGPACNSSILINKLIEFYKEHGEGYRSYFETYIFSLSEATDMLSQWRAYADQATGCCIEFDFSDSRVFTIPNGTMLWALEILPTIYEAEIQKTLIQNGIDRLFSYLDPFMANRTEIELGVFSGALVHALEPFSTSFKHPGFAEEREWRLVASGPKTIATTNKKQRGSGTKEINYLECLFLQENSEKFWQREILPISGIKFGPLTDEAEKTKVSKLLSTHGYTNQVVISDSCIPLRC
jgi:hypothetical protein